VLDGAPADGRLRDELLAAADVVRADAREAGLLARTDIRDRGDAAKAAAEIRSHGPGLVALAVDDGNYFAWRNGELLLPLTTTPVADTTGAGDAFTAGLIAGLARGYDQEKTARASRPAGRRAGPGLAQPPRSARPPGYLDRAAARSGYMPMTVSMPLSSNTRRAGERPITSRRSAPTATACR
jgi:ribokinase